MKAQATKPTPWVHLQNSHQSTIEHVIEVIGKFSTRLKIKALAWKKHRRDRAEIRRMLMLNETILRDIGITRADLDWAIRLPRDQNASLELQKLAHPRKAAQMATSKHLN